MNILLLLKRLGLSKRGSFLLVFYGVATLAFIAYGMFAYGVDETTLPILLFFILLTLILLVIGILMLIYVKEDEILTEKKRFSILFLLKTVFASFVVGIVLFLPLYFLAEFIVGSNVAQFLSENMHEVIDIVAISAFPFVYRKME